MNHQGQNLSYRRQEDTRAPLSERKSVNFHNNLTNLSFHENTDQVNEIKKDGEIKQHIHPINPYKKTNDGVIKYPITRII